MIIIINYLKLFNYLQNKRLLHKIIQQGLTCHENKEPSNYLKEKKIVKKSFEADVRLYFSKINFYLSDHNLQERSAV